MSENATFGGNNPNEKHFNIKPIKDNPKIVPQEFKQNIHNDDIKKIRAHKEKGIEAQKLKTKEQLSELKDEIGIFEGVEPDTQMCSYKGLKIKFPGKNIKEIKSIASSTGGAISNIKLSDKETLEFNWITPNTEFTNLTFFVENKDGSKITIQRKVSLLYTPYDARGNYEIKKEENKTNNARRKEEKKIKVTELEIKNTTSLRFIGTTPDTRSTQYADLTMKYDGLTGKKIKNVVITSSNGGTINNISILEGNKIKYNFLTPNFGGTILTFKFEFTNGKFSDSFTKTVNLPNIDNKQITMPL